MNSLGEKLKRLREERKLTLKEVAEYLGVGISAINSYELYGKEPSLGNLVRLAQLYNVSTDYLLGKDEFCGTYAPEACERIERALRVKRISDRDFANELHDIAKVPRAEVFGIFKEKRLPNFGTLKEIAAYLDIPLTDLVGDEIIREKERQESYLDLFKEENHSYLDLALKVKKLNLYEKVSTFIKMFQ